MRNESRIFNTIRIIHKIEDWIVVILLASIITFALAQIILRNVFDDGFVWAESLLRVLVLWLGLFGALLAARNTKQINIDVLSKYMSGRLKNYIACMNNMFAAIICIIISYYSIEFLKLEYEASSYAFEKVPFWITASVIPISFFIMSSRYALKAYTEFKIKSDD